MENETSKTIMAETLARLRKVHGLTQEQVADILKIKRSTYAYYEKNITPPVDVIYQLKNLFSVPLHVLMYGVPENSEMHNVFNDSVTVFDKPNPQMLLGFSSLKKEEKILLANYRMLPENVKSKIYTEVLEQAIKAE